MLDLDGLDSFEINDLDNILDLPNDLYFLEGFYVGMAYLNNYISKQGNDHSDETLKELFLVTFEMKDSPVEDRYFEDAIKMVMDAWNKKQGWKYE